MLSVFPGDFIQNYLICQTWCTVITLVIGNLDQVSNDQGDHCAPGPSECEVFIWDVKEI